MCHTVLARHIVASRPTRAIILSEVTSRLTEQYGAGMVASPSKTVGYELLRELSRGTNAFEGSTKGKRSMADRPPEVYGRLRATRPCEYVLLDTTRLDVFAMEPATCQGIQCELTASMDLYDRCIMPEQQWDELATLPTREIRDHADSTDPLPENLEQSAPRDHQQGHQTTPIAQDLTEGSLLESPGTDALPRSRVLTNSRILQTL
jgi:hypothetical protein